MPFARAWERCLPKRVADDKPTYHVNWLIAEGDISRVGRAAREFKSQGRLARALDCSTG